MDFSHNELQTMLADSIGKQTSELHASASHEVVHRDDLVLM